MGDVFYDSDGPRADPAIAAWKLQTDTEEVMTVSEKYKPAFVRGNKRLEKMLAAGDAAQRVGVIRAEMAQADRADAMGLSAIRRAAQLTQAELAQRMGIKRAAVSGLEAREDLLLSTLANFLAAAGATDIAISARLGDRLVKVSLPTEPVERESRTTHTSD